MECNLKKVVAVAMLSTLTAGISLNGNALPLLSAETVNKEAKEIALGAHLGMSEEQYERFAEYMSNSAELYQKLGLTSYVELQEYAEYSYYVRKHISIVEVDEKKRLRYIPSSADEKYVNNLIKTITKHMEENEKVLAKYVGINRHELQLMKSRYIEFLGVLNTYDDALSGQNNVSALSSDITDCSPTNAMSCITEAPNNIDPFSLDHEIERAVFATSVFDALGLGERFFVNDYVKIDFGGYVQTWAKKGSFSSAECYSGCNSPTGTPP